MGEERIRIQIEADGLSAVVSVATGAPAGPEGLAAALEAAGVRHGVDPQIAEEICEGLEDSGFSCQPLVIARATPPEPACNGELRLEFEVGLQAGSQREDESLDFLERQLLKPVEAGQRIGQLTPPTEGRAGVDVRGEELCPAPGKPLAMVLKEGVELAEGGEILATLEGVILYQAKKSLSVVAQWRHTSDVAIRSGNLDMAGSVSISGSVTRNLSVRTSGDCDVGRDVDGGSVVSGGSVLVRGRIHCGDGGRVTAGGDLSCRHIEGGTILAGGVLRIATDCVGGGGAPRPRNRDRPARHGGRCAGGDFGVHWRSWLSLGWGRSNRKRGSNRSADRGCPQIAGPGAQPARESG